MRFLSLSEEEEKLVEQLYKTSPNHVVRKRCLFLKLSMKKYSMKEIAKITSEGWYSIWRFFNAWEKEDSIERKQKTLGIGKGRGAKKKLEEVKDTLPDLLQENSRNLEVVLANLLEKKQINVCKTTLQAFLKGTGL